MDRDLVNRILILETSTVVDVDI